MKKLIITSFLVIFFLITFNISTFASDERSWNFKVYLDKKEIGYQNFKLTPKPNGSNVSIEAKFDVDFLFINVYSYRHNNSEIWKDGCLQSIESKTDDNSENFFVLGSAQDEAFTIKTQMGEQRLNGCIKTFSYWDANFLNSTHLLNSQTGEFSPVEIRKLGNTKISVSGQLTPAIHYHISTRDFEIELWYSPDHSDWLALQSTTVDGNVLRYQKDIGGLP
ncbi:MAG: DUF6134 family protein [Nitrospinales bacterium]